VLDSKDREWVAYRDVQDGSLKVAGRQPDGWSVLELDDGDDVGTWIDAALDSDGNMAIAYHDRARGVLKYAWNQDGSLQLAVVDDGAEVLESGSVRRHPVGQHCSLAFGRDGLPRILYLDGSRINLKLVVGEKEGELGQPEILDARGSVGFYSDLAVGPDGLHAASCKFERDDQDRLRAGLQHYQLQDGTIRMGGGW
jgi:hypothetical protein